MTTPTKRAGQAVALAAATSVQSHLPEVEVALDWLIRSGQVFTADTLRDRLTPEAREWVTHHHATIGALFTHATTTGRIRPIGYTPSRRPERRGNPIRVWRGAE